jgi:hypothetical protein
MIHYARTMPGGPDTLTLAAIEAGPQQLEKHLAALDKMYLNVARSNRQNQAQTRADQKAADEAQRRSVYGYRNGQSSQSATPQQWGGQAPQAGANAPQVTQAPNQAPAPAGVTSGAAQSQEPPQIAQLPDQVKSMGKNMFLGQTYPGADKDALSDANAYQTWYQGELSKAAQLRGPAAAARIQQLAPDIWGYMQQIKAGQVDLAQSSRYGRAATNMIGNLMNAVYGTGGWSAQFADYRKKSINDFAPNGRAGQALYAASRLGQSALQWNQAISAVRDVRPVQNAYQKWLANHLSIDPRWAAVFEAGTDFMTQSVIVQRAGRSASHDIQARVANAMSSLNPEYMRAALKIGFTNDNQSVKALLNDWNSLHTGQQYPGMFDKEAYDIGNTFTDRLDVKSGRFLGSDALPGGMRASEPGYKAPPIPGSIAAPKTVGGKPVVEGQTIWKGNQEYLIRGGQAIPIQ